MCVFTVCRLLPTRVTAGDGVQKREMGEGKRWGRFEVGAEGGQGGR